MPEVDWNQGTPIHIGNGGERRIYSVGTPASHAFSYPFFDETDPDGWVFRAEWFFDVNLMPENEKLEAGDLEYGRGGHCVVSMGGWSATDSSMRGNERNAFGEVSTILRGNDV